MKLLKPITLAVSTALLAPALWAQTQDPAPEKQTAISILAESAARVPSELGSIFSYPWDEPDQFKKYALGIGLLVLLDKPVTRFYQGHVEERFSGFKLPDPPRLFPDSVGSGADGWLLLGIGGTYLGGLLTDDVRAQKTGIAATKALTYSFVVSQLLLKSLSGRNRPNPALGTAPASTPFTDNPYDWGHVHGFRPNSAPEATAFPSFHFTAYFAAAKVYQEAYGNYWAPYSLMTIGLLSNIKGHNHWVSDMAAGALIGTLIGSSVSKNYGTEKSKYKLEPVLSQDGPGLLFSYRY